MKDNQIPTMPTSVFARLLFLALLFTLSACSTLEPELPWYTGEFRTSRQQETQFQMSASCKLGQTCAVYGKQGDEPLEPVAIPTGTLPTKLDVEIPNNNLEFSRRAVSASPALYEDPHEGFVLRPLRSLLESQTKFAECVALDDRGSLALCSLSTDSKAVKSVVLLSSTMNSVCKDRAFCAYLFVPLERVRTK